MANEIFRAGFARIRSLLLMTLATTIASVAAGSTGVPHLDLEMTGADYARALARSGANADTAAAIDEDPIEKVLAIGKRNLDWLVRINSRRAGRPPLSFSNAENQNAFPPEAPRIYNVEIIQKKLEELTGQLPAEMRRVLIDGGPLTDALPVDEKAYLEFGCKTDIVYQLAARWKLLKPYLLQLALRKKDDICGYYFLSKIADLRTKLDGFNELPVQEKSQMNEWLIGLCFMQESESNCRSALELAAGRKEVWGFYSRYLPMASQAWNKYFVIPVSRSDVSWKAQAPELMTVPFSRPDNAEIADFLKLNIEDEWRWNGWQLRLDFVNFKSNSTTRIEFEAGTTPHVNHLGGSVITMDSNMPLSEYDVQWGIRHEYGHTLGFPDCYLEFYDPALGQIISYQLDISNLMCSRRGHLKETHYQELKRVYAGARN